MEPIQFEAWPKTPRLFKEGMIITEKIDGTNAAIGVVEMRYEDIPLNALFVTGDDGREFALYAQSRNRIIAPASVGGKGADNYDFANWVWGNAKDLVRVLGPGLHFGEWWGAGIARNYGQTRRYFSLFNTSRWKHLAIPEARLDLDVPDELRVVPVLNIHQLDTEQVRLTLELLKVTGSQAAPGFMNPEGVCVFLPAVGRTFKVTFDGDEHKFLSAS